MNAQQNEVLGADLRDQVLERLGFSAPPACDPEGLAAVYEAWCRHVPFDNIRKWIQVAGEQPGTLPGSSADDFFRAWLEHGTGGTCWAGNGALCVLLMTLGFDVVRGVATMLVSPEVPPNHGTVVVRFGEADQYLVDASILHLKPMRLDLRFSTALPYGVWTEFAEEKWLIHWVSASKPDGLICRVEYFPTDDADFQTRHENTRAWSPFNYQLSIRTFRGRCCVGASGLEWYQLSPDGKFQSRELTRNERREMLIDQLGYSEQIISQLPTDKAVPPPPWSKTALSSSS